MSTRRAKLWRASQALAALVGAIACSDAAAPVINPPSGIRVLSLQTYDGSGQAVHPDAAATPLNWGGGAGEQLFVTPYPYGDATKENPSLFTRASRERWLVPSGVINPIARPDAGYLSDPDQVYNPETNELFLYYRAVNTTNNVYLIRGTAPTRWSAPTLVASAPNHSIVSPTVVRRGPGDWLMWSVNSGSSGCTSASTTVDLRRSSDGINWTTPEVTDIAESPVSPWHIDVEWIPSRQEFWSVYNVKESGSCTTAALHFARSVDGLHWTPALAPVLARGAIPAFMDIVYRSSFEFDDVSGRITLWYSGAAYANGRYVWRIATETLTAMDFFTRLSTPPVPGSRISATDAPPLTNDTAP